MKMSEECCCPLVWSGHGDPKPDPKRVDPDCTVHSHRPNEAVKCKPC